MKKNNSNKVKLGASDKIVRGFGYVVITIYALACIFPFLLILGSSFTAEEVIRQRMLRAVEESEGIDTYDYIVVNDKLEDCIAQINTIVNAARHTPSQNIEFIGEIRKELKEFLGSR